MNQNKKVLQFVLLATGCLLALSLFVHLNKINSSQLQNISIISDIVKQDTTPKKVVINEVFRWLTMYSFSGCIVRYG